MIYSGIMCDNCRIAVEYQKNSKDWLPGKTDIIRFARKDGWSIGISTLCPNCRKRGKRK